MVVTNTPAETSAPPTATITPEALATEAATATATATATMEPADLPDYSSSIYLDDRSTAAALILSYTNAINRHEFVRAYSYWQDASGYLGSLYAFTSDMNNVFTETVVLGEVLSEGAAGSVYFTVPAAVTDSLSGGGTNKYAVCYMLRFPQPANYGAPPITPMHIVQYTKTSVSTSISDANVIAAACGSTVSGDQPAVEDQSDISSANYIDNRSGPLELVKSLLNAINRKEYVRAYSYWENPTAVIGSYSHYSAGFSNTGSVTASYGTIISDAGAGQYYYKVPLAMIVTTTVGSTQTFVGCYTIHLSNPNAQGSLPFKPMSISNGYFTQYPNGTDVSSLLGSACK